MKKSPNISSKIVWKICLYILLIWKCLETLKLISFYKEKVNYLHKYCPPAPGKAFSPKLILGTKVKNSVFWKILYWGIFCNWVALNINLKSEWVFSNTNSCWKGKIKWSGTSQHLSSVSSDNLGQKLGDKLKKLSKIGFPMECLRFNFFSFFT